jgi:predicted kinase
MNRKILVMGLLGSGKTAFTRALAPMLNAVVFNNDEVRADINRDLDFSMEDPARSGQPVDQGDRRDQR